MENVKKNVSFVKSESKEISKLVSTSFMHECRYIWFM